MSEESIRAPVSKLLESPTTVVELGESVAASYCGRLLLKLGASVTKVEEPSGSALRKVEPLVTASNGDTLSATFTALNAGKRFVQADVGSAAGRDVVGALLRHQPDFILMSGTAAEWTRTGLSPGHIKELAPQSIIGRVTMFGDDGPYRDLVGGDLQAQALGGLMNMVGAPEREPLRIGGSQAQRSTGLALLTGFALAMYHRGLTGQATSFTTSVLETVSHVEWKGALLYQANGSIVTRGSTGSPAILRARDGFFAFFYRPEDWHKVVTIMDDSRLEQERFATKEARDTCRPALLEILNECAGRWTKRELYHRTQAARMTTGYMATMSDLLQSQQYLARGFFEQIDLGAFGAGTLPSAAWDITESER